MNPFTEKNAGRRLHRGEPGSIQRHRYNDARSARRSLTNGAFGHLKGEQYLRLAFGTGGPDRPSEDGEQ
jgi:hypothetical protein